MKRFRYRLRINDFDFYEADSLGKLLWGVVCHRLWHLWRGDGWID